jgi:hypothetical protein
MNTDSLMLWSFSGFFFGFIGLASALIWLPTALVRFGAKKCFSSFRLWRRLPDFRDHPFFALLHFARAAFVLGAFFGVLALLFAAVASVW